MDLPRFPDLAVLVVEDEGIIALLVEDMLKRLGCTTVWHAGSVDAAFAVMVDHEPALAVLDLNLGGQPPFEIAAALDAASVPFIFATGYGAGGVPPAWAGRPTIQKPFTLGALAGALRQALDKAPS
jgi:CheY-like chemotaxis protein